VENRLLVSFVMACFLAGASAVPGRFAPQADIGQRDRAAIAGVLTAQQDAWNRGDVEVNSNSPLSNFDSWVLTLRWFSDTGI
jgi:hypothetical protein